MVIGASGALLSWWFRRRLPESPRWLESRGRVAEADAIMSALERESFRSSPSKEKADSSLALPSLLRASGMTKKESGMTTTEAGGDAEIKPGSFASLRMTEEDRMAERRAEGASFWELWKRPYLSRTVMLVIFQALQTIGFYGFANWAPTFLLKRGVSLLHSLEYTLLIALVSPLGPLLAAFTSDRMERKWTIVVLALLVAGLGLGFGNSIAPVAVVGFGALLTLANYWFSAAFHAYQAELFPTRLRATGVGFTYSWSRLSAAFTSILIGAVLVHGVPAVFAVLAVAMILVAGVVGVMGPRTHGLVLEEIAR
jgi:MFS transporter, putative metabolite:H+ symporter